MAEAVVVVPPTSTGEQDVQRGHGLAPLEFQRLVQPLGVLRGHGGDHHGERLVGGEEAVPAGEDVAFEPSLAVVLAEDLHHPALGSEVVVRRQDGEHEGSLRRLEDRAQPVAVRLVRAEEPEARRVLAIEVAHQLPEPARGLLASGRGLLDLHRVRLQRRHDQGNTGLSVGPGVGAHPELAAWAERPELGHERAVGIEQLRRPVAAHPGLEQPEMRGVIPHAGQRDLVGAEGALDLDAVHDVRSGPALGRTEDEHRPARAPLHPCAARRALDAADALEASSSAAASAWWTRGGSSPSTKSTS